TAAHEGGGTHGHSLRTGALFKGRSTGQCRTPDDGAHEPPDGHAPSDPESPRRKDEQGRNAGGVPRRHLGPHVLGGGTGGREKKRITLQRSRLRPATKRAAIRGGAAATWRQRNHRRQPAYLCQLP